MPFLLRTVSVQTCYFFLSKIKLATVTKMIERTERINRSVKREKSTMVLF